MAAVNGFDAMKDELKDEKVFDLAALLAADIAKVLKKDSITFQSHGVEFVRPFSISWLFYLFRFRLLALFVILFLVLLNLSERRLKQILFIISLLLIGLTMGCTSLTSMLQIKDLKDPKELAKYTYRKSLKFEVDGKTYEGIAALQENLGMT